MTFNGQLSGVTRDFKTNKLIISFQAEELIDPSKLEGKRLTIEAKQYRERRSRDSNAYAWSLLQKMAEALETDKWDCYLFCLQRYSRAFDVVLVATEGLERFKSMWRTVVDLGEVKEGYHQLQVYYGSSTFNTKEMSVFLDGVVSECKELGIETLTPNELEDMKRAWDEFSSTKK